MVSTKIIFRTDKSNSASEHPLYLRLIKNRKSKYISLGVYLLKDHWDEEERRVRKSHPNAQRLNKYIAQKISEAQGVALDLETNDNYVSPRKIKDTIIGRSSESFIKLYERYLKEVEANGSYNTFNRATTVLGNIKRYLNFKDILLDEITIHWLKNFENYLRTDLKHAINTVFTHLASVRRIMYMAVREELLPYEKNPFLKFHLKSETTQKDYLTEAELSAFESVKLEKDSLQYHCRNIYSFASQTGLRVSDLLQLKWKNFDGERIVIRTQKTSSVLSLKLSDKLLFLLAEYRKEGAIHEDYIFPVFSTDLEKESKKDRCHEIQRATIKYNQTLKRIATKASLNKNVTSHSARRNFGIHLLRKGANIVHVSRLLSHKSVKTTEQFYLSVANADLDTCISLFN